LLLSGDDSLGLLDWASGATRLVSMPDVYRYDGALALGSQQAIRTFGLTWHGAHVLVACHERIGVLDCHLTHRGFLDISPLWFMTHAIAVRDDTLYTCNARVDVLGVHDLAAGEERFVDVGACRVVPNPQHLKPLRGGYEHDRHHPNAVVVSDEHVAVLVHPVGESGVASEVRVFDRKRLVPVGRIELDERPFGVYYAHDLAVTDDGVVMWCDTFRHRVRASDGRSSDPLGDDTAFLRGLAVNDTDVYVGLAARRGSEVPTAHVVRLDARTLSEVERVAVPFPVEICTIRILDGPDHAHPGVGPAPVTDASASRASVCPLRRS
jgi:hypothetical protein